MKIIDFIKRQFCNHENRTETFRHIYSKRVNDDNHVYEDVIYTCDNCNHEEYACETVRWEEGYYRED